MQRLPGSQLCSGHDGVEERDILAARQKHKNDCQGLSCRGVLGGGGGGLPTTRRCRRVQSLPSFQEKAQQTCWASVSRSLAEEDVLLRNGAGHQEINVASGGQHSTAGHPGGVAPQALFERWPRCSALSSWDSAFPSHLLN